MASLYRGLWSRLGRRPWTYISWDSIQAHPNWWVFGLSAGSVFLSSAAQALWDWRIGFFAIGFLTSGYILGHLFWCSNTPSPLGMRAHRYWWGLGLGIASAGTGCGARRIWDWEVALFLVPIMGAAFVLGHVFWCRRPTGLGRVYRSAEDGGPAAPGALPR